MCTVVPAPPVTLAWAAAWLRPADLTPCLWGARQPMLDHVPGGSAFESALAVTQQLLQWVGMGGAVAGDPLA